jgi:multimeric flavodoxin WrbA
MNILAINGSPHGINGATGMLLSEVVKSAQAAGAAVTTLVISQYTLGPCRACDACHKTGVCAIKDDFPTFRDALLAADGIILASPNYITSVSAQLKALMDRCCGLLHCLALQGKHAAAVVTSGGDESEQVEQYLLRYLRCLGSWTVGSVGASARELFPAASSKVPQAAAGLGATLVEAIASGKTYPQQVQEQAAFAQRMKQLVAYRKDEWPFEYEYWKSRGWL